MKLDFQQNLLEIQFYGNFLRAYLSISYYEGKICPSHIICGLI